MRVKLLHPGEEVIPAKTQVQNLRILQYNIQIFSVPFELPSMPYFGLKVDEGGLYSKMESYYFGDLVKSEID